MRFTSLFESLTREVAPPSTRIIAYPDIVWVFGGPRSVLSGEEYCSYRNVFLTRVYDRHADLSKSIRVPEDYKEWNRFNGYPDLLEFERDAGYLSRASLIFCEGYGSVAELGTFAADGDLNDQVIAAIARKHYEADAYIALGPIERLLNVDDHSVCVIDATDPTAFEAEVDSVIATLKLKLAAAPKTYSFRATSVRDQFLLIADLIDLFLALSQDEVLALVSAFQVRVTRDRVRQLLKQLELFDLVRSKRVMNVTYYTAAPSSKPYVHYQAVQGLPNFDRARFKTEVFKALTADSHRDKAFKLARQDRATP